MSEKGYGLEKKSEKVKVSLEPIPKKLRFIAITLIFLLYLGFCSVNYIPQLEEDYFINKSSPISSGIVYYIAMIGSFPSYILMGICTQIIPLRFDN